ncbi:MAG: SBBP repeat-containing protein, partial [Mariprofundus sp.]
MKKYLIKNSAVFITLSAMAALLLLPLLSSGPAHAPVQPGMQQPALIGAPQTATISEHEKARIVESYGKQPLFFEHNQGQTDAQVKYISRGQGYALFLTPTEAVLALSKANKDASTAPEAKISLGKQEPVQQAAPSAEQVESRVLRMRLVQANPSPNIHGEDQLAGVSHYYTGNDASAWVSNAAHVARVLYDEIYPGIDVAFYGNQKQLEYDFTIKPGASPAAIHLAFTGADSKEIDAEGNLILHLGDTQVIQHAPLSYQLVNGQRQAIESKYMLAENGDIAFDVAAYDAAKDLIIDPVLVYSTYLGGNGGALGKDIAVDASGNAYVSGYTYSSNYPTLNAVQATYGGYQDAFVTKLDATGALSYSTYLGGWHQDVASGIAVDASGNAYVTGYTRSPNYPTLNAVQTTLGGYWDVFVTKLDATGALSYSTYLCGSSTEDGRVIAVDASGNAYVSGYTYSSNFPTLNAV